MPDLRTLVRLAWGAFLLAAPGRAVRLLGGTPSPGARNVARVLGTRHVAQAVVAARDGGRHRLLLATIDWLHAASGLALAAVDRRWRRPALADAVLATAFGVSSATVPRRGGLAGSVPGQPPPAPGDPSPGRDGRGRGPSPG